MKDIKSLIHHNLQPDKSANSSVLVNETILPVLSEKYFNQLSLVEKKILSMMVRSDDNKRISELSEEEVIDLAGWILETSVIVLQLSRIDLKKPKPEDMMTIQSLTRAIASHSGLTVKEIKFSVEQGLSGKYLSGEKDFVHFSPSNVSMWINKFVEGERKNAYQSAISKSNIQLANTTKEVSDKEVFSRFVSLVNQHINQRLKDPSDKIVGASDFMNSLVKYKIVTPTAEEITAAWKFVEIRNMRADKKTLERYAKTELYNRYIDKMADGWLILDEEGKQKDIEV